MERNIIMNTTMDLENQFEQHGVPLPIDYFG